jgi:hypothetical protein
MKKTYRGSCHCGSVRFEVDADLEAGTGRCNCSYCQKVRNWSISVKPDDFRLLCDEVETTSSYRFGSLSVDHRFCSTCGLHAYGSGDVPEMGGAFKSVAIACLDDLSTDDLAALPIRYFDGRDNNWWNEPRITRYL